MSLHTIQPRELVSYAKETQTAEIQAKDEDQSDSETESKTEDKENLKPELDKKEELENEKTENSQPHLPKLESEKLIRKKDVLKVLKINRR